ICPKPVSSRMMNSTFGAPSRARLGAGQAGLDTSKVRPITPGNAWPDLYSLSDIFPPFQLTRWRKLRLSHRGRWRPLARGDGALRPVRAHEQREVGVLRGGKPV